MLAKENTPLKNKNIPKNKRNQSIFSDMSCFFFQVNSKINQNKKGFQEESLKLVFFPY
jgi:hypothetical protein